MKGCDRRMGLLLRNRLVFLFLFNVSTKRGIYENSVHDIMVALQTSGEEMGVLEITSLKKIDHYLSIFQKE